MKKNLVLFAIIGVAMITLSGCGKDPITVVGANGTEYETVEACCADNDYEAAHELLSKIKKEEDSTTDGDYRYELYCQRLTGTKYLYEQECRYLVAVGDDAAQKRLFYLLDERFKSTGQYDFRWNRDIASLIDLALAEDNDDLVLALLGSIKPDDGYGYVQKDRLCSKVLDVAIVKGNQSLAKKVLLLYKGNGDKDTAAIKEAQKRYEKAFGKDAAN